MATGGTGFGEFENLLYFASTKILTQMYPVTCNVHGIFELQFLIGREVLINIKLFEVLFVVSNQHTVDTHRKI